MGNITASSERIKACRQRDDISFSIVVCYKNPSLDIYNWLLIAHISAWILALNMLNTSYTSENLSSITNS